VKPRYIALAFSTLLLAGAAHAEQPQGTPTQPGRLTPFASKKELTSTLEELIQDAPDCRGTMEITSMAARKRRPVLSPARLGDAREAVQEGGIVKRHGDYLVILHRRRLFTVAIGKGALRPVAAIPAVGVGTGTGHAAQYQDLLLLGDRVVLTSDSSELGIEIASFRIARSGALTREGTWHLRQSTNCLSSSHVSYVIGSKLIIYSWHDLDVSDDASRVLPGLMKWHEHETVMRKTTRRIRSHRRPGRATSRKRLHGRKGEGDTLHTLTQCDLAARVLKCSSTVLLGGEMREFHVAPTALYIWFDDDGARSHIVAARVSDGGATELDTQGRVTSIEATPSGALALGDRGGRDAGFAIAKLDLAPRAALTAQFATPDSSQARALDGFQYDPASLDGIDTLAVPLLARDAQKGEYLPAKVSMAFFANEGTSIREIGSIASHEQDVTDDTCDVLGCEEWFQNARALFLCMPRISATSSLSLSILALSVAWL
jgi:hypothetical protein